MDLIGLYYPYIHFRDDAWLKLAALYWPRMARIVPPGYALRDSETVRGLSDELDFTVNVDPRPAGDRASRMMLEVLREHGNALPGRYRVYEEQLWSSRGGRRVVIAWGSDHDGPWAGPEAPADREAWEALVLDGRPPGWQWRPAEDEEIVGSESRMLVGLHVDEVSSELRDALVDLGLAVTPRYLEEWVAVHAELAWVYKCVLTDQLASMNQLQPITHETAAHSAAMHWTAEDVAAALLEQGPETVSNSQVLTDAAIGLLAVELVVPARLDDVPVEKVVEVRRRYGAEFDAFRDCVAETAAELRDRLVGIDQQAVLDAYVHDEVRRRFQQPLGQVRAALRGIGLDTALSAANMKFEVPAAAMAGGGALLTGHPVVAGVGGVVFGLLSLRHSLRQSRAKAVAPLTGSYLWRVEQQLAPRSLLGRVSQLMVGRS